MISVLGAAALLAAITLVAYALGVENARSNVTIREVTAANAANAMQRDEFFSDFGRSTLVIHGVAQASTQDGTHQVFGVDTQSTYQTLCELGSNIPAPGPGNIVTVVAQGGSAERQAHAVMFTQCQLVSP